MNARFFWTSICLAIALAACGTDESLLCSEANNCTASAEGAQCIQGYQWVNPTAAGDYRCEEIPIIPSPVDEFGTSEGVEYRVVGTSATGLSVPRGLAFHPDRPTELWTVNRSNDHVVIYNNPDKPEQDTDVRYDAFRNHFMEEVSSIAFGANNTFATCHESDNTYNGAAEGNDFMGPTLWPGDLDIFATVNQNPFGELGGSHLDMLHQSPLCMGITHHADNKYWVFDGHNSHIVYYDFQQDHGPGGHDHSDGIVRRYTEAAVSRVAGVPSNLVLDKATGWLYVADTGNSRIIRLDTNTGTQTRTLNAFNEPLAEFSEYTGATVEVFVASGLQQPSGLFLSGSTLLVSDYATGEVIGYDAEGQELDRLETPAKGIMGITVSPTGDLWYVDGTDNTLVRVVRTQ